MTIHGLRLFFLAVLMLLAVSAPASAEAPSDQQSPSVRCAAGEAAAPAPALVAGGWSVGQYFSGTGGRTRVVQFCVVTMCIALFIMMRKLN